VEEAVSPALIKASLKAYLAFYAHRPSAFIDVQLLRGGAQAVYVITTEAGLVPRIQQLLEDKLNRSCTYTGGSFIVHGREVQRLLKLGDQNA
jgi:hypothetical protein